MISVFFLSLQCYSFNVKRKFIVMKKIVLFFVLAFTGLCVSAQEVNDSVQQLPVSNENVMKEIQQLQLQINEMSQLKTSIDANSLNELSLEIENLKKDLKRYKTRIEALEEMNCQQAADLKYLGKRQLRSFWEGIAGAAAISAGIIIQETSGSEGGSMVLVCCGSALMIVSAINSLVSYRAIRKKNVAVTPTGIIYSF